MDMPRAVPESHPLHRLFRGLTEYAFMNDLGIGDPPLRFINICRAMPTTLPVK